MTKSQKIIITIMLSVLLISITSLTLKTGINIVQINKANATPSPQPTFYPREINSKPKTTTSQAYSSGSSYVALDNEDNRTAAWICAKKAIEDNLKNPSSAKFASYSASTVTFLGDNEFQVISYVDATNSYGAVVRTNFMVTIELINNGKGFHYSDLITY